MKPLPVAIAAALPVVPIVAYAAMPGHPGTKWEYPHAPAAIVRIECYGERDGGIGTAFKVGLVTYVTAAHVVHGRKCTIGGEPVTVDIEGNDNRDFAVLTGPATSAMLPFSCKEFRLGRFYLARGYAGGGYELAALPWLATTIPWGSKAVLLGEAYAGMSGGPLIDRRGRVRGVVNTRLPSMALPLSETPLCR